MALSSQSRRSAIGVRSAGGSRGWSRKKRARQRRARRVFGLAVLAGAAGLGWWALGTPGFGGGAVAADGEPDGASAPGGAELSTNTGHDRAGALPEPAIEDRGGQGVADATSGSAAPAETIAATPEEDTAPVIRMGRPLPKRGGETDLGAQIREAASHGDGVDGVGA